MLELKKVTKIYQTEGFKQIALDEVSLNFRKNEFASILGPSGSGKTTLLNIIGGLDKYTSGDLVINGISTKEYTDRNWDSYRNHRVGFVFQSYNLIGHQTVLSNVELALTLSGVSKVERRKKAIEALDKVGLKDHMNKKPNQLSGGQMQRVAIARALVNNPDIILADEPTGALDSETSTQVMDILKDIAKEKLVIMVTHNDELAKNYSTRIIKLKDGHILDDTNPYNGEDNKENEFKTNTKKTSMKLRTALSLSLNNLMTKKGRTFLTAFAGSIGIIGIALILSLSNGVHDYIDKLQKETLSSYPLTIENTTMDISSMMMLMDDDKKEVVCEDNKICTTDDITINPFLTIESNLVKNNLKDFKTYLDSNEELKNYTTDIQYVYDLDLQIYSTKDNKNTMVNPNTISLIPKEFVEQSGASLMGYSNNVFQELINNNDLLNGQYEILSGALPKNYNELVLVVNEKNELPISVMYALDLLDRSELNKILEKINNKEKVDVPSVNFSYDDIIGTNYKLILNTDYYKKENGVWIDKSLDEKYMNNIIQNGLDLKIVGVIKLKEESVSTSTGFVGYNHDLVEYVINNINDAKITKEQKNNPKVNILTNKNFDGFTDTYENVLKKLGIADLENPKSINIYPENFEAKEEIQNIIEEYNKDQDELNKITYTDVVGTLMSSVTTMVDIISYILIAFVAISLVVSSIMIAIITYISVLERTKEIGILRAIGASKKDISRVFNAETIIEGLISGILGIAVTILLCIPINAILKELINVSNIAKLPIVGAIILIVISVILTVMAGLIPSKLASKKDPVVALRSE